MPKAAAYTVLVDGLECASGDGETVRFSKGQASPRNEYEEVLLNAAVEAGHAKPPATPNIEDERKKVAV